MSRTVSEIGIVSHLLFTGLQHTGVSVRIVQSPLAQLNKTRTAEQIQGIAGIKKGEFGCQGPAS
jgi:hypothetical protein